MLVLQLEQAMRSKRLATLLLTMILAIFVCGVAMAASASATSNGPGPAPSTNQHMPKAPLPDPTPDMETSHTDDSQVMSEAQYQRMMSESTGLGGGILLAILGLCVAAKLDESREENSA